MLQSWRWFGPRDPISLTKIRQAGATGIVTALHDIPAGEVWPKAAIAERKALIEAHGMRWSVVESLPVHTAVRLAEPGHERYIERYQESLANTVRREIEWLRRGAKARSTKAKGRIQEAGRLIDELARSRARNVSATAGIDFSSSQRRTRRLVVARGVSKSLGGRRLILAVNKHNTRAVTAYLSAKWIYGGGIGHHRLR